MGRAGVLQWVRQTRFEGLLERHERGELSQAEAAEMLGVSERTFRRWRDRLRDEGPEGLCDRRIGKPSSRRAAAAEIQRILGLYEERYAGFTVKHFHEQLAEAARLQAGLHGDPTGVAGGGAGAAGAAALGASQEAATAADGGHDAASGRFALRLAAGRCSTIRFGGHPRRTRPTRSTPASSSRRKARLRAFARSPR
jgi:Winged helix-turn helix